MPTSAGPTPQQGALSLHKEVTLMPQRTASHEPCKDQSQHNTVANNDSEADETCATEDDPGTHHDPAEGPHTCSKLQNGC